MKKAGSAVSMMAFVLLAGCDELSTQEGQAILNESLYGAVQAATSRGASDGGCRFVPTISMISSILALKNPLLGAADPIARAICDGVNGTGGESAGSVQGIPLDGFFLQ
ncbi:hypothetical protein [Ruegeria sp. HKCCA0370]|uniref:hypothetical protein n=1 Tax=Ruegeria sp. HKCCA0370 TaxID=2682995 RepID=UPI0014899946|nr:hypothetical protein [Ruegeria sp. HKCCA0370]